jgi:hypothetical protein
MQILPQYWFSSFIWFSHGKWTWIYANSLGHKVTRNRLKKRPHNTQITVHTDDISFHLNSHSRYSSCTSRATHVLGQMLRDAGGDQSHRPHEPTAVGNFNVTSVHCEFSIAARPRSFQCKLLFTGTALISELWLRHYTIWLHVIVSPQLKLNS